MAATRIELPFWPTSAGNLSWSADNLIAVGGGESIAILVPRLNTKGPNDLSWDSIVHRVNLFTAKELPFIDPLSSVNWSIGEELSMRHVTSLEWSPPGLARFGTCALAILHSNHVLVLWECTGQPHIKDKWRRCLMVNRAVKAYYSNSMTSDGEAKRVRQRIRAFAWLPSVRRKSASIDSGIDSHLAHSEHYLAVSTDGGDILIMKVWSPHDVLDTDNLEWGCAVVHRIQLPSADGKSPAIVSKENGVAPVTGATSLAFSDWDNRADSRLAYIARERLFLCDVHYEDSAELYSRLTISAPREYAAPAARDLSGPLRFAPMSTSLLVFGPDKIVNLDTAAAQHDDPRSHNLDGRWDVISGLAFTVSANEDGSAIPDVHFVSHLSTASSSTSRLPISLKDVIQPKEPNWQNAIQENMANFSASYDLGSNVQERTWGIASSPLGDFVATCISLLPSDSPAHVIQSEQRSLVAITLEYDNNDIPLPRSGGRSLPEDLSAETLLYSLRQYVSRGGHVDGTKENTEALRRLTMATLNLNEAELNNVCDKPPSWSQSEMSGNDMASSKTEAFLNELRARIFYEHDMFSQRMDRLIAVVLQHQPKLQLTKENYSQLTNIALALPDKIKEASDLSRKISIAFAAVKAKVDSYGGSVDPEMTVSVPFIESCSICHQDITLESLRWSRCAGGHQFSRCTLTFLSIMEPGLSKTCRICNTLYINEDALPSFAGKLSKGSKNGVKNTVEVENTGDSAQSATEDGVSGKGSKTVEPQLSLARLLFAACDKCILCGGRFVA